MVRTGLGQAAEFRAKLERFRRAVEAMDPARQAAETAARVLAQPETRAELRARAEEKRRERLERRRWMGYLYSTQSNPKLN